MLRRLRTHPVVRKFAVATENHRLTVALVIAVIAALTLVGISISLYYGGGFSRFDLSRPGYEHERDEIAKPAPLKTYDTTSPITQQALADFLREFDGRQKSLTTYGDFRDASLSDEDLQIVSHPTGETQQ